MDNDFDQAITYRYDANDRRLEQVLDDLATTATNTLSTLATQNAYGVLLATHNCSALTTSIISAPT